MFYVAMSILSESLDVVAMDESISGLKIQISLDKVPASIAAVISYLDSVAEINCETLH